MSGLDIAKTRFDATQFEQVAIEKLPSQVISWIDSVISYLKENPDFDESVQSFIVTELNSFFSYAENAKDIPSILSKPIRLELCNAYRLVYTSSNRRFLFETVNKLVKIISASKPEKLTGIKKYIYFQFHLAISIY